MTKANLTYTLYTANSLPHLSLDEILLIQGLTHKRYRQWLVDNDKPLYAPTPGLSEEIQSQDKSREDLRKQYNMSGLDINTCLYATGSTQYTRAKKERAAMLRATGTTELDLLNASLPPDMAKLSLEITARRERGDSVQYLAELYGYTVGRISQLNTGATKKPRLTKQVKEAIRQSDKSASELAKQYNTTINTIYVLRREQECKNT